MLSFHSKKLTKKTVELVAPAPQKLSVRSSLCGAINKLLGLNKSTASSPVLVDAGVGRVKQKGKGKKAFRRSSSKKTSDRRLSCDWDCSAAAVAADPLVNYRVRIVTGASESGTVSVSSPSASIDVCPELSPAASFSTLGADSSSLNTLPSSLASETLCFGTGVSLADQKWSDELSCATRADLIVIDTRAQRIPVPLPVKLPVNFSRPLFTSSSPLSSLGGGQPWEDARGRVIRERKVGSERSYFVSLSFVPAHIAFAEGCSVEVEHM